MKDFKDYQIYEDKYVEELGNNLSENFKHTLYKYMGSSKDFPDNPLFYNNQLTSYLNAIKKSRKSPEYKHLIIPDNLILSLSFLFKDIIDIYINCYYSRNNSEKIKDYFIRVDEILAYRNILKLNSTNLKEVFSFIEKALLYILILLRGNFSINIENSPLNYSFNNLLDYYKDRTHLDSLKKTKGTKKLKDYILNVSREKVDLFINELVNTFTVEEGKEFAVILNLLYTEDMLTASKGMLKDLHDTLEYAFPRHIGDYKTINKYFPKDINKEIKSLTKKQEADLSTKSNEVFKQLILDEIKSVKLKLDPIISKYKIPTTLS